MMYKLKNAAVRMTASTLFLSLLACGQGQETSPSSQVKVTNGRAAGNDYASVIMLQFKAGQDSAICTGTFVNDHQVITAAHCVYDILAAGGSPSAMTFVKKSSDGSSLRVAASKLEYHPAYTANPSALGNHDIAVVSFPRGSAPAVTPLYAGQPRVGQAFTIVGFGLNDYKSDRSGHQSGSGSGVKRQGQNQIASIDSGMIRFYGLPSANDASTPLGQDSASGSGDSGGPMLIDGALAATTSSGGLAEATDENGRTLTVKASNYVDLNLPANREFLSAHLAATPGW